MLLGMSIPITNPRQADLAARYRPQSAGAITQDTRNTGQKFVDSFNNWFRQTGLNNYLPNSEEASNLALSYAAPFTAGQIGDTRGSLSARQSKQQTPLPFAADAALYAAGGAAVPLIGAGAKAIAKPYNAYRAMPPENQALYKAMQLRGLFHGSRDTGPVTAKPFTLEDRGIDSWERNWFGAPTFAATGRNVLDTKGRQVAEGYTRSGIGSKARAGIAYSKEGYPIVRGAKYRFSEPMSDVANRKILDLTQGTLDEVDPALYRRLVDEFDDPTDPLNFAEDLAKMDLTMSGPGMGGLHMSQYSPVVRPILEEAGYDTIKHLSGQAQGNVVTPVYAFLNPAGMKATPTLPSLGRVGDVVDARISNVAQKGAEATGAAGAAIKEGGASVLDSLAVALNRENMSSLPAPVRDFVAGRTAARGSGENFADVRQFNQNPQLVAFLKKLGLDRLWADAPEAARNLVEPAL